MQRILKIIQKTSIHVAAMESWKEEGNPKNIKTGNTPSITAIY